MKHSRFGDPMSGIRDLCSSASEAMEMIRRADAETDRMRLRLEGEFEAMIAREVARFVKESRGAFALHPTSVMAWLSRLENRRKGRAHGRRATRRWAVRPRQRSTR